jgi:hypothetical protein
MRIYSAHVKALVADPDKDVELVKEGFNWYAALFSVIWALWNRMWLVALGFVVVEVVASAVLTLLGVGDLVQSVVSVGIAVLFGFLGNDLRRWTLTRTGFQDRGVVAGQNHEAAMLRFFDHHPDLAAGRF